MVARQLAALPVQAFVHVENHQVRRLTRSWFTRSVNGLYQQLGPQGMIARVGSPRALCAWISSTSSRAIIRPISAESAHRRKGHFSLRMRHQVLVRYLAPVEEL